jgi:hypothetical protein
LPDYQGPQFISGLIVGTDQTCECFRFALFVANLLMSRHSASVRSRLTRLLRLSFAGVSGEENYPASAFFYERNSSNLMLVGSFGYWGVRSLAPPGGGLGMQAAGAVAFDC